MAGTSTFEKLLAYAYNETGLLESDRIQRSIDGDPIVQEEFGIIVKTLNELDRSIPVVPDRCINAILEHA